MSNNNKFWAAHYELKDFCKSCQSGEKAKCDQIGHRCNNFRKKRKQLYYKNLYTTHPCRQCLVRPACDTECEKYQRYFEALRFANNDLRGEITYYSKDKIPFITGPKHILTKEYMQSQETYRKIIDFEYTENYMTSIRSESFYTSLFDTLRQHRDYMEKIDKIQGVQLF